MLRKFTGFVFVCVASTLLLGASCQRTTIKVNGKVYKPAAPKEASYIQQAKDAQLKDDAAAEEAAWKGLLREAPNSPVVNQAHYRIGVLSYKKGRWEQASRSLSTALQKGLSSSKRQEALFMYGTSLYRLKRYPEALKALEEAYPRLPASKKRASRKMLVEAARASNNDSSLVRWLSAQIPDLGPAEQKRARARVQRAIDGSIRLDQLQVLYNQRSEGKLAFPYSAIGLRLARSYFHQHEYGACQKLVDFLLANLPEGEPLRASTIALKRQLRGVADQPAPATIGVIYPMTGRGKAVGPWVRNALTLATEGIPSSKLRVVYADSGSSPAKAVKSLEKLVRVDKVIAIFGPVFTSTSVAVAHRAQELGVPIFSITPREDFTKLGSFIFRNNLTLSRMGRAIARYAVKKQELRRFAIFYPDSPYGRIQTRAFWKEVERLGATVVGAETYGPNSTDMTGPARRLVGRKHLYLRETWRKMSRGLRGIKGYRRRRLRKKLEKQMLPVIDFDAIFIPETYRRVAMIAPTLAQQDIEVKLHYRYWEKQVIEIYKKRNKPLKFVQLLGTNGWNNETLFLREPRHVVGGIFCVRYFPKSKKAIVRSFVRNYQRQFFAQVKRGNQIIPPIHISAYAYDTMKILVSIATKANAPKTREGFRKALLAVKEFPGVTGPISIQPDGEALAPIRYLVAHRKKEFRLRYTAKELIP